MVPILRNYAIIVSWSVLRVLPIMLSHIRGFIDSVLLISIPAIPPAIDSDELFYLLIPPAINFGGYLFMLIQLTVFFLNNSVIGIR